MVEDLPPAVATVADDPWYDRFLACFDTIADRLAFGAYEPERLACCVAEEMALHLVIEYLIRDPSH